MKTAIYANGFVGKKSKVKRNKWRTDMRTAHDMGYAKGWEDTYDIPKRVGAKTAATYGYRKGLTNRKKADKYTKQYKGNGR